MSPAGTNVNVTISTPFSRGEQGRSGFARYKRDFHAYLHNVAFERWVSVPQAVDEMEIRRWRWRLEMQRIRGELIGSARERRGAIWM